MADLEELTDGPNRKFQKLPLGRGGCHTPNTLIYSRFGHVPHLTRDVFDAHLAPYSDHGSSLLYQIPLGPMFTTLDIIGRAVGIRHFCRLPEATSLHFTLLDPLSKRDTVFDKHIHVWSGGNRIKIDMNIFKRILNQMNVDSFTTPFDFDTVDGCSEKKLQKSLARTTKFLDDLFQNGKENDTDINDAIISIGGGFSTKFRSRFEREFIGKYSNVVQAFSLDFFDCSEEGAKGQDGFDRQFVAEAIREILKQMPPEKLRLVEGCFNPDQVLFLFHQGIDIFDSSFVTKLAEKGMAFRLVDGFPLALDERQYTVMDLNEERYCDDHSNLFPGCECYTCHHQNHTCAYVNHLLRCKEMLASTLLTLHNMREWFRMFSLIRSSLS